MKHYLENHKFYVINEEKLVYKVGEFETYGNADFITFELELVAGLDYVNVDESDVQDWVEAENFVEDVQYEYVNQLPHPLTIESGKEIALGTIFGTSELSKMVVIVYTDAHIKSFSDPLQESHISNRTRSQIAH